MPTKKNRPDWKDEVEYVDHLEELLKEAGITPSLPRPSTFISSKGG